MKNNLLSERLVYNGESQTPTHLHLCTYNALVMQEVSGVKFHPVAALHLKSHIVRCKCASVVSVRTGHISGIGTAGMRNIGALCYHCCRNGKPRRVVVFVPCAEI